MTRGAEGSCNSLRHLSDNREEGKVLTSWKPFGHKTLLPWLHPNKTTKIRSQGDVEHRSEDDKRVKVSVDVRGLAAQRQVCVCANERRRS